ncbi:MAG TPA: DUF6191 domain-containing protein [Actinocrinis sp.]|uniref:DUF6191 domain-containing protein n=1 Tax=Actinocrinis sp. TaxID=1920516 RepID=UPI002DDD126D|nr:DUF6191 domain-containing protein [Actinocrinis sp.]HEV2347510.1 DUF6191 domain-containing protein [Actinocrinis sp.]
MSIFFDLFSSGNRHRTEELRRLENTREEEAQGELHRGPIDLNSGSVVIRVPAKEPAVEDDDTADDDSAHNDAVHNDSAHNDTAHNDVVHDDAADAAKDETTDDVAAALARENGGD